MAAPRYSAHSVHADDIAAGRIEPHYVKVLTRLLAAHALAEKFTAIGYQRALETIHDPRLRPSIAQNYEEERKHARLVYQLLEPFGVSEAAADRSLISALKSPSFAAPRYFAEQAEGGLDLVMGSVSLDMTGYLMIGVNYRESSYEPHARTADLILEEEAGHEDFAAACLRDAVEWFGADQVNEALRAWLPRAVNFFGPPGSGFTFDCIRYGLKQRDNGELADLFLTMLERRVVQAGLAMPTLTRDYPHSLS
jgi:1,2-phenylacetyl-CoA epoxidase catalytic subunit